MPKNSMCIFLCLLLALSFSACSASTEITEKNITQTVLKVEKALKSFDEKELKKYVESDTLSKILSVSGGKEQFTELGQAIFDGLSMQVKSVDLENSTVTVAVKNRKLTTIAEDFATELRDNFTTFQLLGKLDDESFINSRVPLLTEKILDAQMQGKATEITLKVKKGKKNLVLSFDDDAENAVSGGALGAIMKTFSASL
jgi:hypothetical protein